ncbi:helix-turn-helix transcriptional regulator [Myxococcus sp. AB036A]|uniref:ArsR/SmtB family transcription factor n=1 Tax=Myxococcus sp. AB036A TaxID=2562793 RepID=UPI0011475F75|nr:metalloregulator ArsR/SmtB family transcription factor [Myxococcus sp. AB036A]
MIETFTALADPNRFRIVEYLLGGARSVGAIGEALNLNQPQVSKHLRVLKEARLVDVEARAQQRLYGLRPEPLRELNAWLERYRDIWDERLGQLDSLIEELKTQDMEAAQRHPRKKKG